MEAGWCVRQLAEGFRSRALSPVEVVRLYLDRIERLDGRVRAFVQVEGEAALEAARAAEAEIARGRWRGFLHGVPVAVKDNIDVAGLESRNGSEAFRGRRAERDSGVWSRLRGAGAVLIGKLAMHEVAWGVDRPPTRNPWDLTRSPGLSSGGAGAAVAAGMCAVALGTDTGGSVRIPASCCGVVGLKPTYGRIGRAGVLPHSWWLDHVGTLTRYVEDAAIVLGAIAGRDPGDPSSASVEVGEYLKELGLGVRGLRIGVPREYFFDGVEPGVAAAVGDALACLERGGALLEDVSIPHVRYGLGAILTIELASAAAWHEKYLRNPEVRARYGREVRVLLNAGRFVLASDLLKAERLRRLLLEELLAVFQRVEVLVTPTLPLVAWRVDQQYVALGEETEHVLHACWRFTFPFNLTGLPAVSVPCGFSDGLPVGLQIVGRPFEERKVLRVAEYCEKETGLPEREPSAIASLRRGE
jgi:aspartyl-tRNA(Asn)/glutamyl-tRNA(Gln) amidotransferase subunit A